MMTFSLIRLQRTDSTDQGENTKKVLHQTSIGRMKGSFLNGRRQTLPQMKFLLC